ncbi:hypothetical protein K502DRAFT_365782 [Neoconidiobolus thromboides FSU 785]|nr:hypothetical protein K502DRAFT_365782 [Neoconidiobolus thromboides FSU 785]
MKVVTTVLIICLLLLNLFGIYASLNQDGDNKDVLINGIKEKNKEEAPKIIVPRSNNKVQSNNGNSLNSNSEESEEDEDIDLVEEFKGLFSDLFKNKKVQDVKKKIFEEQKEEKKGDNESQEDFKLKGLFDKAKSLFDESEDDKDKKEDFKLKDLVDMAKLVLDDGEDNERKDKGDLYLKNLFNVAKSVLDDDEDKSEKDQEDFSLKNLFSMAKLVLDEDEVESNDNKLEGLSNEQLSSLLFKKLKEKVKKLDLDGKDPNNTNKNEDNKAKNSMGGKNEDHIEDPIAKSSSDGSDLINDDSRLEINSKKITTEAQISKKDDLENLLKKFKNLHSSHSKTPKPEPNANLANEKANDGTSLNEEEDPGDSDQNTDEDLIEELKYLFTNSSLHKKAGDLKDQYVLAPWKRYKKMIDEVAVAVNEAYSEIEEEEGELERDRPEVKADLKAQAQALFNAPISQSDLEGLYNVQNDDTNVNPELGPDSGSSAAMLSGVSLSDVIIVERCEGTSPHINSNCFCTRVKQWSCPAGHFCMAPNFVQKCTKGFYCPADTFQPSFCCGGYYCPTPKEIKLCPKGHFCQEGSIEKRKCYFGKCPEGSKTIRKYEIFIFFIFFLVVVWIGYSLKERQLKFKRLEYDRKFENISKNSKSMQVFQNSPGLKVAKEKDSVRFEINFENLGLKLPNGIEIMKGVTGKLSSGRTCAIMGPSGAGKTTFISLLTGKAKKTEGKIFINGEEKSLAAYRKLIGFVPQEDIMLRKLNAEEILTHSAMVRLPAELSDEEKHNKVLEYIEYLGLRHVMHTIIGDEEDRGISGGQRKRVNIGMELVADPAILFLDEPTSGLDSSTSVEVCSLLKNIARDKGLTIAAVIHSPSPIAFNEFDDLLLLGKGGRVIYHGAIIDAIDYFDSIGFTCPPYSSPSDYYMDVATGKIINSKIDDFSITDLYSLWEDYEQSRNEGVPFTIKKMIEMNQKLSSNYGENHEALFSPLGSSISSEDSLVNINESYFNDTNGKDKEVTCMQSTCEPGWRLFLTNVISPVLQYLALLFLDILSWITSVLTELVETILSLYQTLRNGEKDPVRNTPGFFKVFVLCLNRAFIQIFRPPLGFVSDQLLHFGCGLFISIAAQNSVFLGPLPDVICNVTALMLLPKCKRPVIDQAAHIGTFLSWGIGFAGISVGSGTFGNERTVYWREASSGIPTFPYFIAKSLSDIPRILIASLMFTCSLIAVYPNSSDFSQLLWIVTALYYWGFSTGYFISALVRKEKASLVGVVVALFWAIAFSGVQPTLRQVQTEWGPNIFWLFNFSAPRWAIAAFYIVETEAKGYMDPEKIGQKWFGYSGDSYAGNLLIVLAIGFVWQLFAFLAFKLANREKMQ